MKKPDAPAIKPGDPLDTAYIAPDFHAAFVVSPRRFLESKLAKAMPGEMLREPEAALGIELRNLEQIVVVLDHIKPEVVVVKKEAVKDDWVLIDSKEGGFQARFPAEPKTSERKTLASTRKVWTLEQEDGAIEYEVSYGDFSKDFEGLPPQSLLDAATRGLEFKPGFKERKDVKQGKIPGAEVVIDDKEVRTFAVHRIFVVGNRSYHASATAKRKPAPPEFARFLDSLQVTQTSPAVGGGDKLFPPELQPAIGAILRFHAAVDEAAPPEALVPRCRPR